MIAVEGNMGFSHFQRGDFCGECEILPGAEAVAALIPRVGIWDNGTPAMFSRVFFAVGITSP